MLLGLRISNFAVIGEVEIAWGAGLTVLTGETGAGKSILVDALGLLLGGRAEPDCVRSGAQEACIEGIFEAHPVLRARLVSLGLPDLEDEVSIRRIVSSSGRSKAYVNGAWVAAGLLAKVLEGEVEIAGQHANVALFHPACHLELLDEQEHVVEASLAYRRCFAEWDAIHQELQNLENVDGTSREELLKFDLEELQGAGLKEGEEGQLELERRKLLGTEKLRRFIEASQAFLLSDDDGCLRLLGKAGSSLAEAARIDAELARWLDILGNASAQLEEVVAGLDRYVSSLDGEPARLLEIEERLDTLRRLGRKHRTDPNGLCRRQEDLLQALAQMENRHAALEEVRQKEKGARTKVQEAAEVLSEKRTGAARYLEKRLASLLPTLALKKAQFQVHLERTPQWGPRGHDHVEFMFSANSGEPVRPLHKVASGGEMSRLLIALKQVLRKADATPCEVLDEVDAGVSGAAAEAVGRLIKDMSSHRQVLCVTHLPQVAAFADAHFRVEKVDRKGAAFSRVVMLGSSEERSRELARMLSGVQVTPEAVAAAQALVRSVRQTKRTNLAPGRAVA